MLFYCIYPQLIEGNKFIYIKQIVFQQHYGPYKGLIFRLFLSKTWKKLLYWHVKYFANFPSLKNEAVRYLKPLPDHATININGSLTSEDVFCTVVSMAVNRNSVHSVTAQYQDVACETFLRYHLKKLNIYELLKSSEKILLQ